MTTPPGYNAPAPQPRPSARNNGLIAALIIGAVVVLVGAGVGVWFLLGSLQPERDSGAEAPTTESSSSPSKAQGPRVGDGAPATEVRIKSLTMSKPPSSGGGTAKCEYTPVNSEQQSAEHKDVGEPGNGKKPDTGGQEMTVATNHGELVIETDNKKAPCTVASYDFLAGKKFFDDSNCHRLTTEDIFVLQCGDPSGTGMGGPTYQYDNEYEPKDTGKDLSKEDQEKGKKPKPNYPAGSVAMANSGESSAGGGTNGSQFFIVYEDTYLPPSYTLFGELTSGLDVVKDIAKDGAVEGTP